MFCVEAFNHTSDGKQPSVPPRVFRLGADGKKEGCILTVGRKNAALVFESDKSVSRDHLHMLLVSNHEYDASIVDGSSATPVRPRNSEEAEACSKSPDAGMILVLDNLGKFGSTVLLLEPSSDALRQECADGNDSDTTVDCGKDDDETTDDEGPSQQSVHKSATNATGGNELPSVADVIWSTATKQTLQRVVDHNGKDKIVRMKSYKLEANQSQIVPCRSKNAKTMIIVVQCGQNGSTLVIQRKYIQFCPSRWDRREAAVWSPYLPVLGGTLVEDRVEEVLLSLAGNKNDKASAETGATEFMNCVVATYVLSSNRQPVTKQFMAWLLEIPIVSTKFLTSFQKQLLPDPNKEEHTPALTNKKDSFFDEPPSPQCRKVYSHYCLLSTTAKHAEIEYLVQAAGASCKRLYQQPNPSDTIEENSDQRMFALNQKPSKNTKRMLDIIKAKHIPTVTQKEIAKAISYQRGFLAQPEEQKQSGSIDKCDHSNHDMEVEYTAPKSQVTQMIQLEDHEASEPLPPPTTTTTTLHAEKPSLGRRKETQTLEFSLQDMDASGDAKSVVSVDKTPFQNDDSDVENLSPEVDARKPSQLQHKRSQPTRDGWIAAMSPQDKKMKRRSEMDTRANDEDSPDNNPFAGLPAATTAMISGLVCRPYQRESSPSSIRQQTKTDFKRFRKNRIIKGNNGGCLLAMQSVLPRESQQLRDIEEERRAVEEQQRVADQLFQHGGEAKGTRKRRR